MLRDVSLEVLPGEKIGIVGRTGSGKTSFLKLFSRVIEAQSGTVEIDGQDISSLDLKLLRSQFNFISQKPSLAEGTIAENISPRPIEKDK